MRCSSIWMDKIGQQVFRLQMGFFQEEDALISYQKQRREKHFHLLDRILEVESIKL